MSERLSTQGEHTPFVPEDWDGHTQDDDCSWSEGEDKPDMDKFIRERRMASEITEPVLKRFLASPDRTILKRFKRGDVFRIDQFSHEAIVRFTAESYVFGEPVGRDNPYYSSDFWGVACALPTGRVVLMRYFVEFSRGGEVWPGLFGRQNRIVPEVTIHQRYRKGFSNPDVLIKDRDLALYSGGKVAPELEKERGRLRLPNFGSIFRQPVPKPA